MITFPDGERVKISKDPIGIGGEGKVFRVANTSRPGVVAKIYKSLPNEDGQRKIQIMTDAKANSLLAVCTWPLEPLWDGKSNQICGFTMQDIRDSEPLHHFYSPGWRKRHYPEMSWRNILELCTNATAGLAQLHDEGIIVGDINPNSIRVLKNGRVMFIDTDSFQIKNGTLTYRCKVGVPAFTAPELLAKGTSFDSLERTTHHDNFGLALLLFHLLFMGRHPFSGVSIDGSDHPLEDNIKSYRYAYASDCQLRKVESPPLAVHPKLVSSDSLSNYFEHAFTEQGAALGRPDARTWHNCLQVQLQRLARCPSSHRHVYDDRLELCPWCKLNDKGLSFFDTSPQPQKTQEPHTKGFTYKTFNDIKACTGKSASDVQKAINQLKCREPFDLIIADRLAAILTGDPSIRRAYEMTSSGRQCPSPSPPQSQSSTGTKTQSSKYGIHTQSTQYAQSAIGSSGRQSPSTFSYRTRLDISACTGKNNAEVQMAIDQLQCKEPFDLVTADRLAGILTGVPSIRRAYATTKSGRKCPSPSPPLATQLKGIYNEAINQGLVKNQLSQPGLGRENTKASRPQSNSFSYRTKADIMRCTGQTETNVQNAIDKLKCHEPFDLVTADRLAGALTGDPSIRRAYLKTNS
jgi:serine/threonine protein kinase